MTTPRSGTAGSWRSSGRRGPLRRPPSPPIQDYQTFLNVPIGNDGIAFPVTFDANGNAQAFAGPSGVGTSWAPSQAALYTSVGPLDPAVATVFVGPLPLVQYQVANFLSGGGAQVALGGVTLTPGWFVWAQWTGGTPGALAFLNVTGGKQALTN
jgi:hypothetical protein